MQAAVNQIVTAPSTQDHLVESLRAATFEDDPFPLCFTDGAFPDDYYVELRNQLPTDDEFISDDPYRFGLSLNESGLARLSSPKRSFWSDHCDWMLSETFLASVAELFYPALAERFDGRDGVHLMSQASLGRTKSNFVLGPHTDMPHRVLTLLFYLPEVDNSALPGTSIYKPRDPEFICPGGPHHGFENFQKMATINFQTNTVFGFVKTNSAFHGVEPWDTPADIRETLQYEIYDADRSFYAP